MPPKPQRRSHRRLKKNEALWLVHNNPKFARALQSLNLRITEAGSLAINTRIPFAACPFGDPALCKTPSAGPPKSPLVIPSLRRG